MEQWIFNEGTESYLDFNKSKLSCHDLKSYSGENSLKHLGSPLDYFTYEEDLKAFIISGDPSSIGITEIFGAIWIIRSLGSPRFSVSDIAQKLASKLEKLRLEEFISFRNYNIKASADLWCWNVNTNCYTHNRIDGLPTLTVKSATTYVYDDNDGWYIATILNNNHTISRH
jgi:hypothetical protein